MRYALEKTKEQIKFKQYKVKKLRKRKLTGGEKSATERETGDEKVEPNERPIEDVDRRQAAEKTQRCGTIAGTEPTEGSAEVHGEREEGCTYVRKRWLLDIDNQ